MAGLRFIRQQHQAIQYPTGLVNKSAREFYRATVDQYTLEEHQLALVGEAAFALQRAASARVTVAKEGAVLLVGRKHYSHLAVGQEQNARRSYIACIKELGLNLPSVGDVHLAPSQRHRSKP